MWKYIRRYLHFAVLAGLFMVGEVTMDLLQPRMMSRIVDEGVLGLNHGGVGDLAVIWNLGLRMILIVLLGCFCGSMNNVFVHISGQNIGNEMRKDCFDRIMKFSFPQMNQFGTGSLVTRVTNDITQVQNFVSQFVRGMLRTLLLTFGSMYWMFRLDARFGEIVACAFPFLVGTLAFCLWRSRPLFLKLQDQLDQINAIMQEDISAIRIIKACVREAYEKKRFGKANEGLVGIQLRTLVIFAFMNPVINAMMYLVVALILLVGSFEVGAGRTTPGSIMAGITYTTQLLHGILMMVMLFQNISRGLASWKRVKEVLESKPEIRDGKFVGTCAKTEQKIELKTKSKSEPGDEKIGERRGEEKGIESGEENGDKNGDLKGEIEFRDVSFAYPGNTEMVLSHINLSIHGGETIGIMGATGCGKTTLLNLISRFYDATEGSVRVDGVDVREYRQEALREKIAVALQKSELFSMTIGENISWGDPNADEKAIRRSAVIAQADEFISSTELQYDTQVAERGMSLSGGQKQRISIARAVLKPAEILIFDDATSALDLKTEALLYRALRESHADCTKIIVAQRIASVCHADRIILMENGEISACGTHEELLRTCPAYQDIYRSQIGEEGVFA
ncbi:ABC transporter ATP-binding protein [Brotaphodocola sp.]|uniref:ABC transporter ATP-binding protein n=1 Tax=Brotaphodocola sp. TaxID=3073577 RepID=UPI003D7C4AD4